MSLSRKALQATSRVATRSYSRSTLVAEPKLHNATGKWEALKAKRPIDHDDEHLVFHTPFNPVTVVGMLSFVIIAGWGSMAYGFNHQQYKQGYWK